MASGSGRKGKGSKTGGKKSQAKQRGEIAQIQRQRRQETSFPFGNNVRRSK